MKRTITYSFAALLCLLCTSGRLVPRAQAAGDDFNNIVHEIEAEYHVHQSVPWVSAFAGFVGKCSRFAGVKDFKMAIFEDQDFLSSDGDTRLDQVIQSAGKSGWQPLIRSFSHRSHEHNYIYIQAHGKDFRVLLVTVEPSEAVVLQFGIDAKKLSKFINEHSGHGDHHVDAGGDDSLAADLR